MENESRMLSYTREGMPVFDVEGNRIGTVEIVFMGGLSDRAIELGADSADSPVITAGEPDNWVGMLKEVFDPLDLPRELKERLLNNGYLLIEGEGLLAADRLVLPEHISSVGADGVHLNALRNELPGV